MTPKIQVAKLSNNLRYLVVPIPGLKSATVLTYVKAGSRYETASTNGLSHFVEHMLFKGTKKYPTQQGIYTAVDNIGGSWNGFTSKEYTGYYVKAATTHLDLAMDIISQLLFAPILPKKELEVERGVIIEEIKMREDEPQIKIEDNFEQLMFDKTTLGWDIIGTQENIRDLPMSAFHNYLQYMYTPNRIVLVIAGGIKASKDLEKKIKYYFGHKKTQSKFKTKKYKYKQTKPKTKIETKDSEQCHLAYGYRCFGRGHRDRYKFTVLATILGGGASSRLFNEIRVKRGLAYYVGSTIENYLESGYLGARAGTSAQTAQEVIKLTQAEFNKIKNKAVSAKELKKAKEYIKGHLLLGWENSFQVAEFFAKDQLLEGKVRGLDEVIAGINQVNSEDVQLLAQKIFVAKNENLAAIGPIENLKI